MLSRLTADNKEARRHAEEIKGYRASRCLTEEPGDDGRKHVSEDETPFLPKRSSTIPRRMLPRTPPKWPMAV